MNEEGDMSVKRKWIVAGILISMMLILGTGCSKKEEPENVQEANSQKSQQEKPDEKETFTQAMETEEIVDIVLPETETGSLKTDSSETYDEQGNIVYESKEFKITLPSSWKGRYDVTSSDGYVGFWRKDGEGGDYAPGIARRTGGYIFGIYFVKDSFYGNIFGTDRIIGSKEDGYYLLCGVEYSPDADAMKAGERSHMYWDTEWIADHIVMKDAEEIENNAVEAVERKILPEDASGTLTGIFAGGNIQKDDDIMYFWSEEGGFYEFYFGGAEKTPYEFGPGDKLRITYQGGNVTSIIKLTENGEPELEEKFFEGTVELKTDAMVKLQDTEGKDWTVEFKDVPYAYTIYDMNESGEYLKNESGEYISHVPNLCSPGDFIRVWYQGSIVEPYFLGIDVIRRATEEIWG